jgi:hypothetical protein
LEGGAAPDTRERLERAVATAARCQRRRRCRVAGKRGGAAIHQGCRRPTRPACSTRSRASRPTRPRRSPAAGGPAGGRSRRGSRQELLDISSRRRPRWSRHRQSHAQCGDSPHDREGLTTIRRGFHTLKAAAMVGLMEQGEMACSASRC